MEIETFLITKALLLERWFQQGRHGFYPLLNNAVHPSPRLIPDTVINLKKINGWEKLCDRIFTIEQSISRQEGSARRILFTIYQRMYSIPIRPNSCRDDPSMSLDSNRLRLGDGASTVTYSPLPYSLYIARDPECNILHPVAMYGQVLMDLSQRRPLIIRSLVQETVFRAFVRWATNWPHKNESSAAVGHNIAHEIGRAGFRAAVCNGAEAHASDPIRGGLFGVADIPMDVIEADIFGPHLRGKDIFIFRDGHGWC